MEHFGWPPGIRLPAVEIERNIAQAIAKWASNQQQVLDAVGWADAPQAAHVLKQAKHLQLALEGPLDGAVSSHAGKEMAAAGQGEQRLFHLGSCVSRVEVAPRGLRIELDLVGCGLREEGAAPLSAFIDVPIERKRSGMAVRLVIGNEAPLTKKTREPDTKLLALMAKAKAWMNMLTLGGKSIEFIAEQEKANARYVSRVINVALLAPDIVQAIEKGTHPAELSVTKLITSVPLPMDWAAQRTLLAVD